MKLFLLVLLSLASLPACGATPLRYDLSAVTGRRDAQTRGWSTWEVGNGAEAVTTAGGVTVTLDAVEHELSGYLDKPGLADGATLMSDGVRAMGIVLRIKGLSPGRHSIATYHKLEKATGAGEPQVIIENEEGASMVHFFNEDFKGGPDTVRVLSVGKLFAQHAENTKEAAVVYTEFEATDKEPFRIHISPKNAPAVLNAFEIDYPDPTRRASEPTPADGDHHVAAESGELHFAWRGCNEAKQYHLCVAHHRDEQEAMRLAAMAPLLGNDSAGVYREPMATLNTDPSDSLTHHAWRVDTVLQDGSVVKGEVWTYRTRSLAFPDAQGAGRFARGGRGGRVYRVTTLADSGPGSFREAVEAMGPRTVVFDVGGRIDLKTKLTIRNGGLTVAGQTAPGKGICISNYNLGALGAEDVVLRYLRVRPGDTSGETLDGMGLASCDHAIVDHCSISWTQDESFSSRGAKNVTLQRTLISEALNIAGHRKYEKGKSHGFAASIGGDIGTFHHNLLAHCAGRNWSLAGGLNQANRHIGRLDIRNNVVFNWDHRTTDGGARQVQFAANYYKPGPATSVFHVLMPERKWIDAFGPQDYFAEGNVMEGRYGAAERYAGVKADNGDPIEGFMSDKPFWQTDLPPQTAEEAYEDVLADVGCNVPTLDAHDVRVIEEVRAGKTTYKGSVSGKPGLPDSQNDVGGWEDYPETHRPSDWDPDGDGMPTEWETAKGLYPNDPADGPQDPDRDGYTNLEDYLNGLTK